MSWSIAAVGKTKHVAPSIASQIAAIKMNDAGEQETVQNVGALVAQTLGTIDPEKPVQVTGAGSMGFAEYSKKTGPYQNVSLTIEPLHGWIGE